MNAICHMPIAHNICEAGETTRTMSKQKQSIKAKKWHGCVL